MAKELRKWLTVALAVVGVLTQVGVLPPALGPVVQASAVAVGEA